ncbi:MAG: Anti-sigma-K factor rskA [Chthoniobacter sp.]|nr:Anti-sigma-K factor rskA [Chthoniobacter sp.]
MTDDARQDRAIEYVLGAMDPSAERAFASEMESDTELQALAAELQECVGALAHSVPLHLPPPHVRGRVLEVIRNEIPAAIPTPNGPQRNWLPWAIAAGLAICCVLLAADRGRLRSHVAGWKANSERWQQEAESRLRETTAADEAAHALDQRAAALQKQSTALEAEIAQLKGRDGFAQMTIATLAAQNEALAKAAAVVVWDEQQQRGLAEFSQLPPAEAGKDYQLWAIDLRYPSPVSAGVLRVAEDGSARLAFQAAQPIAAGVKFAISIEPAGGSLKPTGAVVLAGE